MSHLSAKLQPKYRVRLLQVMGVLPGNTSAYRIAQLAIDAWPLNVRYDCECLVTQDDNEPKDVLPKNAKEKRTRRHPTSGV